MFFFFFLVILVPERNRTVTSQRANTQIEIGTDRTAFGFGARGLTADCRQRTGQYEKHHSEVYLKLKINYTPTIERALLGGNQNSSVLAHSHH